MRLAGVVAVAAVACGGSSAKPTPTVPAPVLSPVPSGVTIDLDHAAKLYHDGDYEGALTIYSAAALNGTPEQKQAGLWEIARIQLQRGQHSDAEKTVRALRATNPPADLDRQALLLLGVSELAQAEFDDARTALEAYLATNGAAWPYADLYLAQVDEHDGKPKDAIDRINKALTANLSPKSNFNALMALGQADEQAGDSTAGVADYRRAFRAATGATDGGEALWYMADAATTGNDANTASDALVQLIQTYPATQRAADAVNDPRLQANAVSPLDKALVDFHHQDTDTAVAALQPVADAGGQDAPQAQYYLGILSERVEDWQGAIDHYTPRSTRPASTRRSLRRRTGTAAPSSSASASPRTPSTATPPSPKRASRTRRRQRPLPRRLPRLPPRPVPGRAGPLAAADQPPGWRCDRCRAGGVLVQASLPLRTAILRPRPPGYRPPPTPHRWTTTGCARRP